MKFGYNFYKVKIQTLETKDFVGFGRKSDAWSKRGEHGVARLSRFCRPAAIGVQNKIHGK